MRVALFIFGALLVVAAFAIEYLTRAEPFEIQAGVARMESASQRGADTESQHDFALLELAASEREWGAAPIAFVASIETPSGSREVRTVEPGECGAALLGPLENSSRVDVAVVSGGTRFGYRREEEIGRAQIVVSDTGGRQSLVIPVRPSTVQADLSIPLRIGVTDSEGWPVEGGVVSMEGGATSAPTSVSGFCSLETAGAAKLLVRPPEDRPDLREQTATVPANAPYCLVTLPLKPVALANFAGLDADAREITLRPRDGRTWTRSFRCSPSGQLYGVSAGEYDASWEVRGSRHDAVLHLSGAGSSLGALRVTPLATVRVTGPVQKLAGVGGGLLLFEHSARSCAVSGSMRDSAGFELTDGRGLTSSFYSGELDEGGDVVFEAVAPGDYELVSMDHAGWVSRCIRVPASAAATTKDVPARVRVAQGTIGGTVRSNAIKGRVHVEIRMLGAFRHVQTVPAGEAYEFKGLAVGMYSVRAISAAFHQYAQQGLRVPVSPWKTVILGEGAQCALDFTIE